MPITSKVVRLTSWDDIVQKFDYFIGRPWLFRGMERAAWTLETSIEREFRTGLRSQVEQEMLWRFARAAPRLLQGRMPIPEELDAAAWLGLLQHHGGATRLMDFTTSPYVALFFAFEAVGADEYPDRVIWAIDSAWCQMACASVMAEQESRPVEAMRKRVEAYQKGLVYSVVHGHGWDGSAAARPLFSTFKAFIGAFPVAPWNPDERQLAQQSVFLCPASVDVPFMINLENLADRDRLGTILYKFELAASLRAEILARLQLMNVSAASLFPDFTGLARSTKTLSVRPSRPSDEPPEWEPHS